MMAIKRTIFIIPGYRQGPSNKAYREIIAILENEGYNSIPVTIPWKKTTISENTKYFLKEYNKIQRKKKYILGFSFGAMIALLASTKVTTSGVVLCSLSPYFKEDLKKIKNTMRHQDFSKLKSATLAKKIKAEQILMLYGSREARQLIKRVKETYHQIPSLKKKLLPIKQTDHNIGSRKYLQTIHQAAQELN